VTAPHEALRAEVVAELEAAGIRARPYFGEALTLPAVVVVPGSPHIDRTNPRGDVPFGRQLVRLSVLCIGGLASAKTSDQRLDALVGEVLAVLDKNHDVDLVTAPGSVPLIRNNPGAKYVAAAISIEEVTRVQED
jgi:hypothetical protein